METILNITLAALAIIGVVGLIVGGVIWLGHRATQRQAAEMADEAGEGDQQAQRGGGGPTKPVVPK